MTVIYIYSISARITLWGFSMKNKIEKSFVNVTLSEETMKLVDKICEDHHWALAKTLRLILHDVWRNNKKELIDIPSGKRQMVTTYLDSEVYQQIEEFADTLECKHSEVYRKMLDVGLKKWSK